MSWAFMNSHLGIEFEDLKTSVRKTGFEWSLRLTSTSDAPHRSRAPQVPSTSFVADWAPFARLAARLFNITPARLSDIELPDYNVHENASAAEIRLLRDLLLPTNSRASMESWYLMELTSC
jgi:hypothetical protein